MPVFKHIPTALFGGRNLPIAFRWDEFGFPAGKVRLASPPIHLGNWTLTKDDLAVFDQFELEMRRSSFLFPEFNVVHSWLHRKPHRDHEMFEYALEQGRPVLSKAFAKVNGAHASVAFLVARPCGPREYVLQLHLNSSKVRPGGLVLPILFFTLLYEPIVFRMRNPSTGLPFLEVHPLITLVLKIASALIIAIGSVLFLLTLGKSEQIEIEYQQLEVAAQQAFNRAFEIAQNRESQTLATVESGNTSRFEIE